MFSCKYYITFWISYWSVVPIIHGSLIFTRYVYVRYADGLIVEGNKILYYVVTCFIFLFALIFVLIWPVFDHLIRQDEFPLNHLKGQICTMVPLNFTNPDFRRKHQKPKIIIGGLGLYNLLF